MRNAHLAINSKKTNQYDMIVKPKFWEKGQRTLPDFLYVTIISLHPFQQLKRRHGLLILLTREALPSLPRFPLFMEDNIQTEVDSVTLSVKLQISPDDLDLLTTFTLRIFEDVFHKIFDRDPQMMPYWLAPASLPDAGSLETDNPRSVLDWEVLRFVQTHEQLEWTADKPASFLSDRFMFDKWDGRYRYFTFGVEPDMRPSDPPAPSMARRRHMGSIMDYCLSLFKNARAKFLATCDWNQPVIRAELVQLRRDLLDKMTEQERQKQENSLYYICPEPVKISAVGSNRALIAFFFFPFFWC